jgi:hypothetical protein
MSILEEIDKEREYQRGRWGNTADDTINSPNDFIAYIVHHTGRWFDGGFKPYSSEAVNRFRAQMIKVAALAVAAVESIDRQRAATGHTFYESD